MNSLYAVSKRMNNLLEVIDNMDLPDSDFMEAITVINTDIARSGEENIKARVYMQNKIEAVVEEIKRLQAVKKHYEKRLDRFDTSTMVAMNLLDRKEIKTDVGRLVIQRGPASLIVDDENRIPAQFIDVKQVSTVRKDDIKKAIKAGNEIDGCHLEYKEFLKVR